MKDFLSEEWFATVNKTLADAGQVGERFIDGGKPLFAQEVLH